jgi:hypothetical protein
MLYSSFINKVYAPLKFSLFYHHLASHIYLKDKKLWPIGDRNPQRSRQSDPRMQKEAAAMMDKLVMPIATKWQQIVNNQENPTREKPNLTKKRGGHSG